MAKQWQIASDGIVTPLIKWGINLFKEYRVCILATLLAGLAAHLFFFSQKLVTFDDSLFTYGQTYPSGRWGLWILQKLVPAFSMPWFHGIVSLLLMSLTMVVLVKTFEVHSRLGQALLSAVIITSALHTSIFLFMFTSMPYALAILFATLSVYYVLQPRRKNLFLACSWLILSLSIYQVYITLVIALLVIALSLRLLKPIEMTRHHVCHWLKRIAQYLTISLVVYFAIAMAIIYAKGGLAESNYDYAMGTSYHVPMSEHITGVYTKFLALFTHGNTGLINTPFSVVLHLILLLSIVGYVFASQYRTGSSWRLLTQSALLLACLPATINLFWLLLAPFHWDTLTVYAFIAIYLLAVVLLDRYGRRRWLYDILALCLAGITMSNIYYDNQTYLKVHQNNVNNFAFYTGLVAQIKLMPELNEHSTLALIGDADEMIYDTEKEFGINQVRGSAQLLNTYSRRDFIIRQIGFDIPIWRRTDPEQLQLEADPRVQSMPIYPYMGSIQAIDSIIVVKLGEVAGRQ